jgi:hypothetical protein
MSELIPAGKKVFGCYINDEKSCTLVEGTVKKSLPVQDDILYIVDTGSATLMMGAGMLYGSREEASSTIGRAEEVITQQEDKDAKFKPRKGHPRVYNTDWRRKIGI